MTILLFININKKISLNVFLTIISLFFSGEVFSNHITKYDFPDKSGFITWRCEGNFCNIFLKKENSRKEQLILKNYPSPSIKVLTKNLFSLFFSCGSPCNYTVFYDVNRGISESFEFVLAVNPKKEIVVVAEKNNLVAYRIFSAKKPLFHIKRNWAHTAALFSAISEAKLNDENLYIKYLEGNDYHIKEETIWLKNYN